MGMKNNILIVIFIIIVFTLLTVMGTITNFFSGDEKYDEEYQKCTSLCAATMDEDFTTHYLCMEECEKQLKERSS